MFKKSFFQYFFICFISISAFSQQLDSLKQLNFRGTASITNNGFSFIPAFSLGKPAAIFGLNVNGGKRFSFEPEFRFALQDGRPWSFIFIYRYKVVQQKRFQTTLGLHFPAVPFRVLAYETQPDIKNTLAVSRVVPFELTPNITINKNHNVSLFCLYARGISDDAIKNTTVVMLRSVSNFKLSKDLKLRVNPQLFYLALDQNSGTYLASNFAVNSSKTPFFIGASFNKPLKSEIAGNPFNWNLSLGYAIDRKLIVKK